MHVYVCAHECVKSAIFLALYKLQYKFTVAVMHRNLYIYIDNKYIL